MCALPALYIYTVLVFDRMKDILGHMLSDVSAPSYLNGLRRALSRSTAKIRYHKLEAMRANSLNTPRAMQPFFL